MIICSSMLYCRMRAIRHDFAFDASLLSPGCSLCRHQPGMQNFTYYIAERTHMRAAVDAARESVAGM